MRTQLQHPLTDTGLAAKGATDGSSEERDTMWG